MNMRFARGLLLGGLAGAVFGGYWMLKSDRATERRFLAKDRQLRRAAKRTGVVLRRGARQAGNLWQTGGEAVKAGWHAWTD